MLTLDVLFSFLYIFHSKIENVEPALSSDEVSIEKKKEIIYQNFS